MELEAVHAENPYYGVARFSMDLGWNEKKARRIRNLAGITALRRSKKHCSRTAQTEVSAPDNALRPYIEYINPDRPWEGASFDEMTKSGAWVQDFAYINYRGMWVYWAVVEELSSRRVLGWSVGLRHTAELVHSALLDALSGNSAPPILHDDQGSEYLSFKMQETCRRHSITMSCSDKGNPWQNGFIESLFCSLKDELGDTNRFNSLEELYEAMAKVIYYYNHERVHTALKMAPAKHAKQHAKQQAEQAALETNKKSPFLAFWEPKRRLFKTAN